MKHPLHTTMLSVTFAIVGLTAASSPAQAQPALPAAPARLWPAIDLDGGVLWRTDGDRFGQWVRLGLGGSVIHDRGFVALTTALAYTSQERWAYGLIAHLVRIESGLGFSGGFNVRGTDRSVGIHAGPSLSVLHIEGQVRFDDAGSKAALLFVRLPIGVLGYALLKP